RSAQRRLPQTAGGVAIAAPTFQRRRRKAPNLRRTRWRRRNRIQHSRKAWPLFLACRRMRRPNPSLWPAIPRRPRSVECSMKIVWHSLASAATLVPSVVLVPVVNAVTVVPEAMEAVVVAAALEVPVDLADVADPEVPEAPAVPASAVAADPADVAVPAGAVGLVLPGRAGAGMLNVPTLNFRSPFPLSSFVPPPFSLTGHPPPNPPTPPNRSP